MSIKKIISSFLATFVLSFYCFTLKADKGYLEIVDLGEGVRAHKQVQESMTENHGIQSLPTRDSDFKHIDHAYSMTAFASQGKTVDSVIGILRSKESHLELSHQRSFYVSLSRARHDAVNVTDNKERLIQSLSEKTGG